MKIPPYILTKITWTKMKRDWAWYRRDGTDDYSLVFNKDVREEDLPAFRGILSSLSSQGRIYVNLENPGKPLYL